LATALPRLSIIHAHSSFLSHASSRQQSLLSVLTCSVIDVMDNLPQELVDQICQYLSLDELKNTLLLSRQFQLATEEHSEAFSHFVLKEDNADAFIERYSGRFFRYLRAVEFSTALPELSTVDEEFLWDCREEKEDLQKMDEQFTRQINFLFSTLKAIESRVDSSYGPGKVHLTIYTLKRKVNADKHCFHRSFLSWRVHLLSTSTLPKLSSVRSLTVENPDRRTWGDGPDRSLHKMDYRVLFDISSKLLNLEDLQCKVGGDEWAFDLKGEAAYYTTHDWEGPRRDSRHDFARALQDAVIPCLRHARLDFLYPTKRATQFDQRRAMPDLTTPLASEEVNAKTGVPSISQTFLQMTGPTCDPFSSSLRVLSYQLRTMQLRVVADTTLFWPADDSTPSWPYLESVSIAFHMATPSGTWYFQGLPSARLGATEGFQITEKSYPPLETTKEDEETCSEMADYNWADNHFGAQYRVDPNNEVLVPFLTAFAKAASLMPSLKEAVLWSPLKIDAGDLPEYNDSDFSELTEDQVTELAWGITYAKPGVKTYMEFPDKELIFERQLWWKVGNWRPDPLLHGLFQRIGQKEHGEGLTEYFGNYLVPREEFEYHDYRTFGTEYEMSL
jgi:hypothetical protein